MERKWKEESLCRRRAAFQSFHELLVQNPLVRRMLVYENQPVFVLEGDISMP